MENALVLEFTVVRWLIRYIVLILVLMENALVPGGNKISGQNSQKS